MNRVIELLNKYNIRPNKRLGQNFLIDLSIADKIIKESDINKNTVVVEIGGGIGSLTGKLLEAAKKVTVIELDEKMCRILENEYTGDLTVINGDVLKTDINSIIAGQENVVVCGNLPYYITTPIIMYFLEKTKGIKSLSFMMQKEVADRLTASGGTKNYGAITPAVNYHADVKIISSVPPECFIPRPAVQSAVVRFDLLDAKRVSPKDVKLMFGIISASFQQRRKTILNAISSRLTPGIGISREQLAKCLLEACIDPSARGETLELGEFCRLADTVFDFMQRS